MNYSEMTDEALCDLAGKGQLEAEETLVLRYSWLVRACARPLFLMGGDSEDLTQEGMFGLITAIRRFDPWRGSGFRAFAEICIRTRLLSAVRAASGRPHTPLNESVPIEAMLLEEDGRQTVPLPENDPESILISRETTQEMLDEIFGKILSPFEAQVLRYYLDGLSYAEIAERMPCASKAVDNAIQRIRRKVPKRTAQSSEKDEKRDKKKKENGDQSDSSQG